MRSTIITIATIAAASIGLIACEEINRTGKEELREQVKRDVKSKRSEESKEAFKLLSDYKEQKRDRDARENTEVQRVMKEFKETSGYNKAAKEVDNKINAAVESHMKAIKYEETKLEAKEEHDQAISDWKEKNYISQHKEQKARIENAKKEARNQEFYATLSSSYDSEDSKDMLEKVKEVISEKEEEIKADAKKQLKKLDKKLNEFEKEQDKIYNEKLKELNDSVREVRNEVAKENAPVMNELEEKLSAKREEVRNAVRAKRTDEENEIESEIELYSSKCNRLQEKEAEEIRERLANATKADEVAAYFKAKKWNKFGVGAVLVLPFVPVLYVGYKYAAFVGNVLHKM